MSGAYGSSEGKGRCAAATVFVRGETEAAARSRLLRDDASPFFFEIGRSYPLEIVMPPALAARERWP